MPFSAFDEERHVFRTAAQALSDDERAARHETVGWRTSPLNDTEGALLAIAEAGGWPLRRGAAVPWLTNRGHANVRVTAELEPEALKSLRELFLALHGDEAVLASIVERTLRPDFFLGATDQIVELDESQHYTSARLKTLDFYPEGVVLGFDLAEYKELCKSLRTTSDRDFAQRTARQFPGPHGRQRQRAYFDALRDFVAPAFGQGPVIRVPAPERDAALAFPRFETSARLACANSQATASSPND